MTEKKDIKSMPMETLAAEMEALGVKKFRTAQLYDWMHVKLSRGFDEMSNLPKDFREKCKELYTYTALIPVEVQESKIDGTRKFLFGLADGNVVESVWMKYKHGNSVCISSQVGCRMGCRFCASTLDGLERNLTPGEMLDQIYAITRYTGERVSNVVVMGTGEPMDNYDNLLTFIKMLTDEHGLHISQRNITVSTCGLVPMMKKLAEEAVKHCDLPGYRKRAVALLDEQMGAVPDSFLYRGRSYTARSFADSLRFKAEDYVQLTSFTHHPFYTPFILEVPDNWEHQCYFNLPLDELEQVVRRALSAGKTVAWHGDVSEDTFSPRQGMALWTQHPVTQEMRQHEFERFLTTDDHMMHLIGTAHDEAGRFYYLLKNSYGRYGAYAGLLYMSEDYFRAKTVSVLLRK